ncbi:MAG: hypothetical protein ABIL09_28490 [Gemmatimonadota bacterium]
MVRTLLRAFVVLRLESRDLYLDPALILLAWLRRPAIELPLEACRGAALRAFRLARRLDQVYPF